MNDVDQSRDEDLAASMREDGSSWKRIAEELELPTSALAKAYVAASDARAHARAHECQLVLFS